MLYLVVALHYLLLPAAAAALGTMHMFNMGRRQPVEQMVVIPAGTTVAVREVLTAVVVVLVVMLVVVLDGLQMEVLRMVMGDTVFQMVH